MASSPASSTCKLVNVHFSMPLSDSHPRISYAHCWRFFFPLSDEDHAFLDLKPRPRPSQSHLLSTDIYLFTVDKSLRHPSIASLPTCILRLIDILYDTSCARLCNTTCGRYHERRITPSYTQYGKQAPQAASLRFIEEQILALPDHEDGDIDASIDPSAHSEIIAIIESLRLAALLYVSAPHSHASSKSPPSSSSSSAASALSPFPKTSLLIQSLSKTPMLEMWAPLSLPGAYLWCLAIGMFCAEKDEEKAWFRGHMINVFSCLYFEKPGKVLRRSLDVVLAGLVGRWPGC